MESGGGGDGDTLFLDTALFKSSSAANLSSFVGSLQQDVKSLFVYQKNERYRNSGTKIKCSEF